MEKISNKSQLTSNEVDMCLKTERKKREHPKDLLISSLLQRIKTKLYNKYSHGWQAFKFLDVDQDGKVTFPEF